MNLAGHNFEDRDLIRRVMRNMRSKSRYGEQRWVLVVNLFAVGSTVAYALCQEFGLDPEEVIKK